MGGPKEQLRLAFFIGFLAVRALIICTGHEIPLNAHQKELAATEGAQERKNQFKLAREIRELDDEEGGRWGLLKSDGSQRNCTMRPRLALFLGSLTGYAPISCMCAFMAVIKYSCTGRVHVVRGCQYSGMATTRYPTADILWSMIQHSAATAQCYALLYRCHLRLSSAMSLCHAIAAL
jgi:hypothetical protein